MKRILSLFVLLFFVAGCGGGSGGDTVETVERDCPEDFYSIMSKGESICVKPNPRPDIPFCENDFELLGEDYQIDYHDRPTWELAQPFCEDGEPNNFVCQEKEARIVPAPNGIDEDAILFVHALFRGGGYPSAWFRNSICHRISGDGSKPYVRFPHDSYDSDRDGEADERWNMCVQAYQLEFFLAHAGIEERYNSPKISLAEGTTHSQENALYEAVGLINASLSEEFRIRISKERVSALQGEPPSGEIYIDFTDRSNWVDTEGFMSREIKGVTRYYPNSAHVWIHPPFIKRELDGNSLGLVAHEVLHAIGFKNHTSGGDATSIMLASTPPNSPLNWGVRGLLWPVDRAALEYLEEYEPGHEVSEQDLEVWLEEKGCERDY